MAHRTDSEKDIARCLAEITPARRSQAEAWAAKKRLTCASTSVANYLQAVLWADRFFEGRDPATWSRHDLRALAQGMRKSVKASTQNAYTTTIIMWLKFCRGERRLPDDFLEELACRKTDKGPTPEQILSDQEEKALLHQLEQHTKPWHVEARAMILALYHLMLDVGLRIGEALLLDMGDVLFPDRGGMRIRMRNHEEGLKTKARGVSSMMASERLRAWMSIHPDARSDSPLFVGIRSRSGRVRLRYQAVQKLHKRICEEAGINIGRSEPFTLHDLRHTCATNKVRRHRWTESELRSFFGWKPQSSMPAHYVHLADGDLYERVLRDAQEAGHTGHQAEMQTCPMCAEEIKAAALKCKHCQSFLEGHAHRR